MIAIISIDIKYEKQFVVLYDQEKRYFKVQSRITLKDIMREIKGKYGKMKPTLQIWKDNGLIKAKRLCNQWLQTWENDVKVLHMRKYLFRKILKKRYKCGNLTMNHCKLIL